MHSEFFVVSQDTADRINAAKQKGSRIIAVGTTSVRTLNLLLMMKGYCKGLVGPQNLHLSWLQI